MKKFTKHAQSVFNHNPNVVKCTESKIFFTEEFAQKVCEVIKAGGDVEAFFYENGISVRILGKSRFTGLLSLWKSKYEIQDAPRRPREVKVKAPVETTAERREKVLNEAVLKVTQAVAADTENLPADAKTFKAIRKVYEESKQVIVKDLCKRFGYDYLDYYAYFKKSQPKEEYFNLLNSHRKHK